MYQIKFSSGGGGASFTYFDHEGDGLEQAAADKANEYIEKQQSSARMFSSFKPPRTVTVVEYDNVKKQPLRSGKKFKLRLSTFKVKTNRGSYKGEYYTFDTPEL